jgi:polyferredoxin
MILRPQIRLRARAPTADRSNSDGLDLLRLPRVRPLVLWQGFPYLFQVLTLLTIFVLIFIAWGRAAPGNVAAKLYAKSNLATLLVWGVWWPLMIWAAVLLGRVWCLICPLELVSNLSERAGRLLGVKQKPVRRWLASGAVTVALYILIQMLVAGEQLHRVPAYTAYFLVGLLAAPLATGIIFKDRAFCRAFCPAGQLLATYGRGGMLAVRAGPKRTCAACADKTCVKAGNRNRLDARSCPSLLNPQTLNSNSDCLVCCQCVKSCRPGNMRLLLRPPFHPSDTRPPLASWPTTLFVMVVSGFAFWELCAEWRAAEEAFLKVPDWLSRQIMAPPLTGYLNGMWAMLLFPLIVWSLMSALLLLLGERLSITEVWRRAALPVAVVVAAAHMTKALIKFASWAGFVPLALYDPSGAVTATSITKKLYAPPVGLLPVGVIASVGAALVMLGLAYSIREQRLSDASMRPRSLLPQFVFAASFLFVICGIAFGGG